MYLIGNIKVTKKDMRKYYVSIWLYQ